MRKLATSVRKTWRKARRTNKNQRSWISGRAFGLLIMRHFLKTTSQPRRGLCGWTEPAPSGSPSWPSGSYSSAGGRSGRWTAATLRSVSTAATATLLPAPRARSPHLGSAGGDPGSSCGETSGCCRPGAARRCCPRRRPLGGAVRPAAESGSGRCHPARRGGCAVCRPRDAGVKRGGPRRGAGAGGLASCPASREIHLWISSCWTCSGASNTTNTLRILNVQHIHIKHYSCKKRK